MPKQHVIKDFETEEGSFSIYDTDKNLYKNRANMFVVLKDHDGYIIRNSLIPEELRRQGLATEFYKKVNKESLKNTGKPLRSSPPRTISTGETLHELSQDGIQLWESFVRSGLAEKLGEKNYRFKVSTMSNRTSINVQPKPNEEMTNREFYDWHTKDKFTAPEIDRERYTDIPGLEGPFGLASGLVVYYDPQAGKYYNRDTDMYLSNEEYMAHKEPRFRSNKKADHLQMEETPEAFVYEEKQELHGLVQHRDSLIRRMHQLEDKLETLSLYRSGGGEFSKMEQEINTLDKEIRELNMEINHYAGPIQQKPFQQSLPFMSKKKKQSLTVPQEVEEVYEAAKDSAKRAGTSEDTVYLSYENSFWVIADNYDRLSEDLRYSTDGKWYMKHYHTEEFYNTNGLEEISFVEALSNAELTYTDSPRPKESLSKIIQAGKMTDYIKKNFPALATAVAMGLIALSPNLAQADGAAAQKYLQQQNNKAYQVLKEVGYSDSGKVEIKNVKPGEGVKQDIDSWWNRLSPKNRQQQVGEHGSKELAYQNWSEQRQSYEDYNIK